LAELKKQKHKFNSVTLTVGFRFYQHT